MAKKSLKYENVFSLNYYTKVTVFGQVIDRVFRSFLFTNQ